MTAAASSSYKGLQGHLVTVASQDELTFLKSNFGGSSAFWIAATDAQSEGTWTWTAGPESDLVITPVSWQTGQPNGDTSANCAVMSSAGWDDQNCVTFLAPYIVEYECQTATTSTCPRKRCYIESKLIQILLTILM